MGSAARRSCSAGRRSLHALPALFDPRWVVGDLGCGTGQTSAAVAPFVARVVAVDRSGEMLQAARRRLRDQPNVDIRRGELEALPIADGELDVAIMMLVLHHVPDPLAVLREAARVLRPGGRSCSCDMLPHDREEYKQQMGHVWLGFAEDSSAPADGRRVRRAAHRPDAARSGRERAGAVRRVSDESDESRTQLTDTDRTNVRKEMTMSTGVSELHAFDAAVKAGRVPYKVKDLALAELGRKEIRLAEHEMPGLMALRDALQGPEAAGRRAGHGQPAHDGADGRADRDAGRARRRRALGLVQHLLDAGSRRGRGRRRPAGDRRHAEQPEGHAGVRLEGRDARGVLVVHERGAAVARRQRPDPDRRRRRRRDAAAAQGRRVREGGTVPAFDPDKEPEEWGVILDLLRRAEGQSRRAGRRSRPR